MTTSDIERKNQMTREAASDRYACQVEQALDDLEAQAKLIAADIGDKVFANIIGSRDKPEGSSAARDAARRGGNDANLKTVAAFCEPGVEAWRPLEIKDAKDEITEVNLNRSTAFTLELILRTQQKTHVEHYDTRAALCRFSYRFIDWLRVQDRIGACTLDDVELPGLIVYRIEPMEAVIENLVDPDARQPTKDAWQGAAFTLSFHLCEIYPKI